MFLVMGITGNVGGAAAEHLLTHGKEVRALVRNREKAANWANRGVELVDGDWNDLAAIEQALNKPPRVYRRLICSNIRRPYRVYLVLHRTPPRLLRVGYTR